MINFFATKTQRLKVALRVTLIFMLILLPLISPAQQKISFGLHADPSVCWFSSDNTDIQNNGARPGFNFGLTFNNYFTPNYAFSTGIGIMNTGGRVYSKKQTVLHLATIATVAHDASVVYKIQYMVVPVGLKLQTNQIGYLRFFSDIGFDPKLVISGKADVPSLSITNAKATDELKMFNLSYHVTAGIEYSLGGTTAMVLGLNFDNNFLDITKDYADQPVDKLSQKILSLRIGVNF